MAKKRANGEGSIRKKPSGRWEGRYTQGIDPVTGRAIQKSVSAKTQAECKEKLAKAIRENRGVPLNHTGDYTAAEWCRLWFETYSKPNIRYNTAKGYEGIIEHHIIPAIGAIKLKQLSSIHIQRMYNDLKENGRMPRGAKQNDKPLSNTFVRRVHAVLQAALKQAVKERLIPYNPCENCRSPPKDKKEMTILPPEKIGRYLQEAEKYGVLPMFYLELSSGLRRGELLALQWTDLNVKERILTVNKQVTRMEGELDVTEPKTKNSVRKVALSQQAVNLLVQEHEQHPDNPILFPSPRTGGYWSPDAVSRINRKLLKNAGIEEHVRFHDLRHTFATMAISSGVDVKTPVKYAGPLQRRVHTGHLYAYHQRYAERCGRKDRRLHGVGHGSQHPGASQSAGGEPVQGDTVRKGRIKETKPKGQNYVPWATLFQLKGKLLHFCADNAKTRSDFVRK